MRLPDRSPARQLGRWVATAIVVIGLTAVIPAACEQANVILPVVESLEPGTDPWQATAERHRGNHGRVVEYACPPGGNNGPVWGTNVYTDDSSVCTAAVHMGIIARAGGGNVKIIIRPGLAGYLGSARNGVTSERWDAWEGSYVFVGF